MSGLTIQRPTGIGANLSAIRGLAVTDGNIIVGNGSTFVAESGATARTSLGLGTTDTPEFDGLTIGSANGIDAIPGSDIDTDLITVGVTGSPTILWDESEDSFSQNKGLFITAGKLNVDGEAELGLAADGGILTLIGKAATSNNLILSNQVSSNPSISLTSAAARLLVFSNSGAGTFGLTTDGNIGAGETSPDTKIHITATDGTGAITLDEESTTPANPDSGTQGRVYIKDNKIIFQFNDGGTVRYKYLDLTGTGVTWVHTTSAP